MGGGFGQGLASGLMAGASVGERVRNNWDKAAAGQAYTDATKVTETPGAVVYDDTADQAYTGGTIYRLGGQTYNQAPTEAQVTASGLGAMKQHYASTGDVDSAMRIGLQQRQLARAELQDSLHKVQLEDANLTMSQKKEVADLNGAYGRLIGGLNTPEGLQAAIAHVNKNSKTYAAGIDSNGLVQLTGGPNGKAVTVDPATPQGQAQLSDALRKMQNYQLGAINPEYGMKVAELDLKTQQHNDIYGAGGRYDRSLSETERHNKAIEGLTRGQIGAAQSGRESVVNLVDKDGNAAPHAFNNRTGKFEALVLPEGMKFPTQKAPVEVKPVDVLKAMESMPRGAGPDGKPESDGAYYGRVAGVLGAGGAPSKLNLAPPQLPGTPPAGLGAPNAAPAAPAKPSWYGTGGDEAVSVGAIRKFLKGGLYGPGGVYRDEEPK